MTDLKAIREFAQESINHGRSHMLPPETVITLLNRLESAETEVLEQARLLGIGGEKELSLTAKLEAAEKKISDLQQVIIFHEHK